MTVEEILEALRAIVDGAEGRDLTDEEAERYEQLEVQLATARRTQQIRQRQQAYNTPVPMNAPTIPGPEPTDQRTAEHRAAFDRYIRTGDKGLLAEFRAQSVGTDSEGGFTAPEEFRQKLVERMVAFGGLANEVETITTSTGNRLPWPTLDDTANEGEIAAEGAAGAAGADLVFGEIELGAFKYVAPGADNTGSDPLRVSVELLQDSAFDIQGLVVRKLGERIARKQADDWVNGVGTTEPFGITTSSGASSTFAGVTPTKDELIDALHSVDPAYRMNAIWVFNDTQLANIRKLDDGNGRPLWLPLESSGLVTTPGGTLLGHRVVIDQAFVNPTAGGGETWGVFGDVREGYVIRRVRDVQLVVDPYTRAANGQVAYTVWARADGVVQNPNSFSLLAEDGVL